MPLYIDEKFANLLSPKLPLFKWKGNGQANFRCPLCGDSKKSKTKKRGYLYAHKDVLMFKCQNCGVSNTFNGFLKMVDPPLHKEYVYEAFKFNNDHKWHSNRHDKKEQSVVSLINTENNNPLNYLDRLDRLAENHPCVVYARDRQIPQEYWQDLYYSENYCKWVNDHVIPKKFENISDTDPRLVIPFYNQKKLPFAYQGRYIGSYKKALRYITVHPDENVSLIFGLDRLKPKQEILVLEGPIDSMFLPNALAAAGSSLKRLLKTKLPKTFIFDNEPRSKEICTLLESLIGLGEKVVIFPESVLEKDINAMVLAGRSQEDILQLVKENTCQGLLAMLKFNKWKKI